MDDPVSRQAAKKKTCSVCRWEGTEICYECEHPIDDIPSAPRWIPVTERLPEEPFGCLVTVWDTNPVTMDDFENILPYFVGWDGDQWNDADGEQCPFEVIAWMSLPKPWKGESDA